jgi:diguanylate cyclase (GGDEF)-like protein
VLTALALRPVHVAGLVILITIIYIFTAGHDSGIDVSSPAFAARLFGAVGPFVVVAWLTAELGRLLLAARHRERDEAHADPVTGLANLATLTEAIDAERVRGTRNGGRYAVVVIELEPVAAEPGESAESTATASVKLIASVLSRALRETDLAARTGEYTFAALLRGADLPAAQAVANRIRHAAHAATVRVGSRMIRIQAQCAAAESPRDGAQARELMAAAQARIAEELVRRENAMPMP